MQRKYRSSVRALLALSLPAAAYAAPFSENRVSYVSAVGAAPMAGCTEALIGPAYDAVVESTANTECFQFVTEQSEKAVKLNVAVAGLPADGAHDVHLIRINGDGSTAAAASDVSGGTYSFLQALSHPLTRWLLMLGGKGIQPGVPVQFQAEVAYVMALLDDKRAVAKVAVFQHVCQETYRAYRKPLEPVKPRKRRL